MSDKLQIDIEPQAYEASSVGALNQSEDAVGVAIISIAISLKRIADALTYQPTGTMNIHDFMDVISNKDFRP